ncbi:MAG: type II toxin-antitoxin system prevent-host-death family antitoxin [Chromatiales bacterium]|nr:type II toxin-antitoxin system prevent-host-death family antitoxin [Gammaproteobacteria bacterium]MBW6476522.1 type II toxin-antitoxin system prevent-host-death family antitoxin [Chromatiales bacterium]
MSIQEEVGAYDAKTHLPAYLRKVEAGGRFVITQRGKPVAELVPVGSSAEQQGATAAQQMLALMREAVAVKVDIRALLEEGRD